MFWDTPSGNRAVRARVAVGLGPAIVLQMRHSGAIFDRCTLGCVAFYSEGSVEASALHHEKELAACQ